MLLKIGKMTPRCQKRHPSDEYIGARFPCDEYTREFTSWCTLISIRTGLQKNFLVNNRPGSQDSPVYYSQWSIDYLVYFALAGSFVNQSRSTPRWLFDDKIQSKKSRDTVPLMAIPELPPLTQKNFRLYMFYVFTFSFLEKVFFRFPNEAALGPVAYFPTVKRQNLSFLIPPPLPPAVG